MAQIYAEIEELMRHQRNEGQGQELLHNLRKALETLTICDGGRPDSGFDDQTFRSEASTPDLAGGLTQVDQHTYYNDPVR